MAAAEGALEGGVSVLEEAFRLSDLPKLDKRPEFVNPLGMEEFDWFVLNVLSSAGITVECIGAAAGEVEKYQAVQIVDDHDFNEAFKETDLERVKFVDCEDMLGLQVKLSGAWHWKVTVVEDNKEFHLGHSARAVRGRAGGPIKTSSFENLHVYEIAAVVPPGNSGAVKCCAAFAGMITINIAFKTNEDAHGVQSAVWNAGYPATSQRRIDVVFANKYLTSVQVRVPYCVFQNTWNTGVMFWNTARFMLNACCLLCSGRLV